MSILSNSAASLAKLTLDTHSHVMPSMREAPVTRPSRLPAPDTGGQATDSDG